MNRSSKCSGQVQFGYWVYSYDRHATGGHEEGTSEDRIHVKVLSTFLGIIGDMIPWGIPG